MLADMKEPAEPRRRLRLKPWQWTAVVLMLLFVSGIAGVKLRRYGLEKEIARELAAIRARGEPVTQEELDAWYPRVPDAENGALVLTQALASATEIGERDSVDLGELLKTMGQSPLSPDSLDKIRRAVSERETVLRQLRIGLDGTAFRYPIELTNGPFTKLPHLGGLMGAAQLLTLEAGLRVVDQRPDLAAEGLVNGLKLADTLKDEPLLISFLVRAACRSVVYNRAAHCLGSGTFDAASLDRLGQTLAEDGLGTGLSRAMVGERVWGFSAFAPAASAAGFEQLAQGGSAPAFGWEPESVKTWVEFYAYRAMATDAEDRLHYIRIMSSVVAACRLPPEQRIPAFSNAVWLGVSAPGTSRFLVSQMLMPALEKSAVRDLKMLAGTRSFRTALALERFRLDSGGSVPESLDALVPKYFPAVPLDPFDGKPLRYIRHGRGYVVYSVGENLTDEQGAAKSDIPFTVEK